MNHISVEHGAGVETHQKCTEHEKADEVNNGEVAATAKFFSWFIIRLGITAFPWKTGQHDLLPCLPCGTAVKIKQIKSNNEDIEAE